MIYPADNLIVSVLPIDVAQGDKQANLNAAASMLAAMPAGTDVAVLPELFSTGFIPDKEAATSIAETSRGATMQAIERLALKHNCAIAGSFLAKSGPWLYNRAFFIEPSGEGAFYDKRHLFSLSKESSILHAGEDVPSVTRFRGWNIALSVCYDLRFPAWLRNADLRYDAMLVPANWPDSRQYAWQHLLQARAIENQAYMVGANRSGQDSFGCYDGMCAIYDYAGKPAQPIQCAAPIVAAALSKSQLEHQRQAFPFWKDADPIEVKTKPKREE